MSFPRVPGNPFIVSTGIDKAGPETRKLIRSHVMLGKNRGKSRHGRSRKPQLPQNDTDNSAAGNTELVSPVGTVVGVAAPPIPNKIGSDLSFIQFADTVEPSTLSDIFRFTAAAKQILFPLERCFSFHKRDTSWLQALASDAAYLNAVACSTHVYIDMTLGHKTPATGKEVTTHLTRTIHLLRNKLLVEDEGAKFSDSTLLVVLTLAMIACNIGEYEVARHHLEGLRTIVRLRGGLETFVSSSKLLNEVLRCDITLALYTGEPPIFFNDCSSSEPLMQYPDLTLPFISRTATAIDHWCGSKTFLEDIDRDLAIAWGVMQRYCWLINLAEEAQQKLSPETLLFPMASVMYRLLDMEFESGSLDEAVRLGLLAFSSNVFLKWQNVRPYYRYLADAYRSCLSKINFSGASLSNLLLWLLFVGAMSIFPESEGAWLKLWLRMQIESRNLNSWDEMRDILKSFMWIDLLHDTDSRAVFDSVIGNTF